jgi:hypothetical protein
MDLRFKAATTLILSLLLVACSDRRPPGESAAESVPWPGVCSPIVPPIGSPLMFPAFTFTCDGAVPQRLTGEPSPGL